MSHDKMDFVVIIKIGGLSQIIKGTLEALKVQKGFRGIRNVTHEEVRNVCSRRTQPTGTGGGTIGKQKSRQPLRANTVPR